jgi:uncharacterized membrane protein YvbJ
MKTCPLCGHQNPDENKFCTYCGNALNAEADPNKDPKSKKERSDPLFFYAPVRTRHAKPSAIVPLKELDETVNVFPL